MREPVKLLLLFVNETDTWNEIPLYQALVQRLHQLDLAGATAQTGVAGFGHHRHLHRRGLLGIPDDRSVLIMAVDSEQKIRASLPIVRTMVAEGLILLLDAELVADRAEVP
jgi:PII-like signaling protein